MKDSRPYYRRCSWPPEMGILGALRVSHRVEQFVVSDYRHRGNLCILGNTPAVQL